MRFLKFKLTNADTEYACIFPRNVIEVAVLQPKLLTFRADDFSQQPL
jgi:hypothetical protein